MLHVFHRKILLSIALGLSFFLVGCNGKSTIINSVPEREANQIIVLLASRGVDASKEPVAASAVAAGAANKEALYDIQVPAKDITKSLAILNQEGFPRARGTSLLDLFGDKGIVPSAIEDRIRYQEGLSEQLAMTIRKMDGIIDANVQITFPSSEDEEEAKQALTASVYVKHQGVLDNPNSLLVTKIKRLISSAIPGLTIENVSVVTDRAIYADITLPPRLEDAEYGKSYVSIWSMAIAKESITRFRFIFYAFCLLVFLLATIVAWMVWKFHKVLKACGGIQELWHMEPINLEELNKKILESEEAGKKEE